MCLLPKLRLLSLMLVLQTAVAFGQDPPLVQEGKEALFDGRYEDAVEYFGEAVLADPKDPVSYEWLTSAREFDEDPKAAEAKHKFGFSSRPVTKEGLAERSRFFRDHEEFQRALDDANELLRIVPEDMHNQGMYNKRMCYYIRGTVYRHWALLGGQKNMLKKSEEDYATMKKYPDEGWEDAVPVHFPQPQHK